MVPIPLWGLEFLGSDFIKVRKGSAGQLPNLWLMFHPVQLRGNKYFSKKPETQYENVTEFKKPLKSLEFQRIGKEK